MSTVAELWHLQTPEGGRSFLVGSLHDTVG